MKVKAFLFAILLCCMLPFIAQGVDLEDHDPPGPPLRAPLRSIYSPVIIETGSGILTLYFSYDLGNICVFLQGVTGKVAYQQSVDTSVQSQSFFAVPAGTYVLTITDAAGNVIKQENIVIP